MIILFILTPVIIWAFIVGILASKRNRIGIWWFILSFMLTPLLTMIIVLIAGEKPMQGVNK